MSRPAGTALRTFGGRVRNLKSLVPVGSGVAVVAALVVAALVDGVREKADLSAYDPGVTATLIDARRPWLTVLAEAATFLGSTVWLVIFVVLAVVWLAAARRDVKSAVTMASGTAAAAILTVVLKQTVARPRPPASSLLGAVDLSPAFPSGHTLNAAVVYGLAALLVARSAGRRRAGAAIAGWLTLSTAVGLSRVYLGYHWMTDVLAGWVVGLGVLATVITVMWAMGPGATPPHTRPGRRDAVPGTATGVAARTG